MHPTRLLAVSFSAAWLTLSAAVAAEDRKAVPVYTNDDLARVSPLREETGVFSTPPATAETAPPERREKTRGESYWRREAERVRQQVEPLRQRAEELRFQMDQRERRPGVRPVTDSQLQAMSRRLRALEQRIRDVEDRFEERARREGALPGWLR
jgi:hypothetical protein